MKKKMLKLKSILTVTLAWLMVISMVGCGQKEEVQSEEVEETGVEETEVEKPQEETTEEEETVETTDLDAVVQDLKAIYSYDGFSEYGDKIVEYSFFSDGKNLVLYDVAGEAYVDMGNRYADESYLISTDEDFSAIEGMIDAVILKDKTRYVYKLEDGHTLEEFTGYDENGEMVLYVQKLGDHVFGTCEGEGFVDGEPAEMRNASATEEKEEDAFRFFAEAVSANTELGALILPSLGSANAASTNGTYEEYVYSLNLQIPSAYGVDASYLAENGPDNNEFFGIDLNCMADQLIQYLYTAYQEGESNPFVFASDYDDTVSLIKAFPNRDTITGKLRANDEDLAQAIDKVLEMEDSKIWISYGLDWNYLENGKELYLNNAAYYGEIEIIVSSIQDGQRDSVKYTIHYDQQGITEIETE
ncbi:MAG: hypothetical protein K6E48_02945 [Lachnospiraceae bacterium]|nr:hypothetical protein [Lachnospiraceae bacterium]